MQLLTIAVLNPSDAEQSIKGWLNGAKLDDAGKLWRTAPDSIDATVLVDKKREVRWRNRHLALCPTPLPCARLA